MTFALYLYMLVCSVNFVLLDTVHHSVLHNVNVIALLFETVQSDHLWQATLLTVTVSVQHSHVPLNSDTYNTVE